MEVERDWQRSEFRRVLPYAWRWHSRALKRAEADAAVERVIDGIRAGRWPDTGVEEVASPVSGRYAVPVSSNSASTRSMFSAFGII